MDRFLVRHTGDRKSKIDLVDVIHAHVEHDEENAKQGKRFDDGLEHERKAGVRAGVTAATLLRNWLMKHKKNMLMDFLDALGIAHKEGAVDDLPATMSDEKLKAAVDKLLAKYPPEEVAVYLNAFDSMNEIQWKNLDAMLKEDPRLQFGG